MNFALQFFVGGGSRSPKRRSDWGGKLANDPVASFFIPNEKKVLS